nr:retrotransposon-related protein [Tanacetum cinerariifolium]
MAADSNDQNVKYALSKLLQMGTVVEYQNEFEMLIKRVTIPESLLKSFYISGLKLALQRLLFRSYPSTLEEAFFRARITEARFEDENNQAVDANVSNQEEPEVKDKQEVKKLMIKRSKTFKMKKERMLKINNNPNGVFNDVGGGGYSKVDGTWLPARRIEDGWHLFDELGSKLYCEYSIKNVHQLSDDKHADYNKKHKREIDEECGILESRKKIRHHLEGKVVVKEWGMIRQWLGYL